MLTRLTGLLRDLPQRPSRRIRHHPGDNWRAVSAAAGEGRHEAVQLREGDWDIHGRGVGVYTVMAVVGARDDTGGEGGAASGGAGV